MWITVGACVVPPPPQSSCCLEKKPNKKKKWMKTRNIWSWLFNTFCRFHTLPRPVDGRHMAPRIHSPFPSPPCYSPLSFPPLPPSSLSFPSASFGGEADFWFFFSPLSHCLLGQKTRSRSNDKERCEVVQDEKGIQLLSTSSSPPRCCASLLTLCFFWPVNMESAAQGVKSSLNCCCFSFQGQSLHPQGQCKVGWRHQWRELELQSVYMMRKRRNGWKAGGHNYAGRDYIACSKHWFPVLNVPERCVLLPSINLPVACFAKPQGRLVGNNSDWKWLEKPIECS